MKLRAKFAFHKMRPFGKTSTCFFLYGVSYVWDVTVSYLVLELQSFVTKIEEKYGNKICNSGDVTYIP